MQPLPLKSFRTEHMEDCVNVLVRQNRTVLVRAGTYNDRPITIRTREINDVKNYYFTRGKDASKQVSSWLLTGGLLVDWCSPFQVNTRPKHDAQFVVEAPRSIKMLSRITIAVERELVIYRPPSWEIHERTVRIRNPPRELCEQYLSFIFDDWKKGVPLSEHALRDRLGLTISALRYIRKAMFTKDHWKQAMVIVMRNRPEKVAHMHVWDMLLKQRDPKVPEHVLVSDELLRGLRGSNGALRMMIKDGCVAHKDTLIQFDPMAPDPNFAEIQARSERASSDFRKLAALVDLLPLFEHQPQIRLLARGSI